MRADQIVAALAEKHHEDVFVPECKDGSSYRGHFRMDAWTMKKSWAHPHATAYEVKVSRSDFLNDDKWPNYLPLCHSFYFVCPHGLIKPEEVGPEAGLMYLSKTGTRLYTKKKAPFRPMEQMPIDVLTYIVMCRTKISRDTFDEDATNRYENWLAIKDHKQKLGHDIAYQMRIIVEKEVGEVKKENTKLRRQSEKAEMVIKALADLGINFENLTRWNMHKDLQKLMTGIPEHMDYTLTATIKDLQRLLEMVKEIQERANDVSPLE